MQLRYGAYLSQYAFYCLLRVHFFVGNVLAAFLFGFGFFSALCQKLRRYTERMIQVTMELASSEAGQMLADIQHNPYSNSSKFYIQHPATK